MISKEASMGKELVLDEYLGIVNRLELSVSINIHKKGNITKNTKV